MKKSFLLVLCFVLPACATFTRSFRQKVDIGTDRPGADFTVFNARSGSIVASGVAPATVALNRKAGYFRPAHYRVVLGRDGAAGQMYELVGRANGAYLFGNTLLGGVLGWLLVDPLSGKMWTLQLDKNALMKRRGLAVLASVLFLTACEKTDRISEGGTTNVVVRINHNSAGPGDVELRVAGSVVTKTSYYSSSAICELAPGTEVTLTVNGGFLDQWHGGGCDGTAADPCVFVVTEDLSIVADL